MRISGKKAQVQFRSLVSTLAKVGLLAGLLGLTACKDFRSPEGVLGTAYSALMNGDSVAFRGTLTGSARKEFGSIEGMARLRSEIAGRKLSIGSAVCEKPYEWSPDYVVTECHLPLLFADTFVVYRRASVTCIKELQPFPGGLPRCAPRGDCIDPGAGTDRWVTTCKVSALSH